jgi:hypothetical protein
MTTIEQAKAAVDEARRALDGAIINWAAHDVGERLRDGGKYLEPFLDAYAAAVKVLAIGEVVAMLRTKRTPEGETITSASHAADVVERVFVAALAGREGK